jgi:hypothetical protein
MLNSVHFTDFKYIFSSHRRRHFKTDPSSQHSSRTSSPSRDLLGDVMQYRTGTVKSSAFAYPLQSNVFRVSLVISKFERVCVKNSSDFDVLLRHDLFDSQNIIFGRIRQQLSIYCPTVGKNQVVFSESK